MSPSKEHLLLTLYSNANKDTALVIVEERTGDWTKLITFKNNSYVNSSYINAAFTPNEQAIWFQTYDYSYSLAQGLCKFIIA